MLEELALEVCETPVLVMLGANGSSQGIISVEVDGTGPQPGNGDGGLLQDAVR
jgi:hypothetical protein